MVEIIMVVPVGLAEATEVRTDVLEHRVMTGETMNFGGGDFMLIRLNSSVSFGIVHGNSDHDSPITIFCKGTDLIGYDRSGKENEPLLKNTYTTYSLNRLIEFDDRNGNGRLDRLSVAASADGGESIINSVDLAREWRSSTPVRRESVNGISWELSLEARNISYSGKVGKQPALVDSVSRSTVLELVRFDFRVTLTREKKIQMVYSYRTVERGEALALKAVSRKELTMEGARVKWKMDHRILGWDYDRDNENPALMLEFDLRFANTYNSLISAQTDLPGTIGPGVDIPLEGDSISIWKEEDRRLTTPTLVSLDPGNITMGRDRWDSRLFWEPVLSRTPSVVSKENVARLYMYRYYNIGPDSEIWTNLSFIQGRGLGVRITGGFTYPPLGMIVHDPGIETIGFRVPLEAENREDGHGVILDTIMENTTATIFISILTILIAIGIAAVLTLSRRTLNFHDQELKREIEVEIFETGRKKKDWDSLKVK